MKNNTITIIKKEFARFFGDRALVITNLLLPGLMIYLVYSLMGPGMSQFMSSDETSVIIGAVNMPAPITAMATEAGYDVEDVSEAQSQEYKSSIEAKEQQLLAVFPDDFEEDISTYDPASGAPALNVELFYNSSDTASSEAYSAFNALLSAYESSIANRFDVNMGTEQYDLSSKQDIASITIASIMPMLMLIFLFTGCMSITPESIAGEKERGTISTLLVTPIKRSELALGKVISLSFISVLSAFSGIIGAILALPKMMGSFMEDVDMSTIYSMSDYALLAFVAISTVLLFTALMTIISVFASSTKAATTSATPLMFVVMLVGVFTMFSGGEMTTAQAFIPVYNTAMCLSSIFSLQANVTLVLISAGTNIICTALCVFIITRLFSSEKVLFSR